MGSSRIIKLENQGAVDLFESIANGRNRWRLRAPASLAADNTWTLPAADAAGYVASDGAGNLVLQAGTSNNQSLDQTYDFGRTITADAGAVAITSTGGIQVAGPSVFGGGPWYDITHPAFGAVAGSDCTAAILAADAAAPAGSAIYFPDNTSPYKLDAGAWLITKQRTLMGFGGATIQALPGTLIGSPMISVGDDTHPVSNFRCYGLNIDGNFAQAGATNNGDLGANASSGGIKLLNVTGAWIEGNYIYGIPGDCIKGDYGDETNLTSQIWIVRNRLGSCYRCNVAMVGGRKWWIVDNLMENYSQCGVDIEPNNAGETCNRVVISGNDIYPSATNLNPYNSDRASAIQLLAPVGGDEATNVRITNNYIQGLYDGATLLQHPTTAIKSQLYKGVTISGNQIFQTRNGINVVSANTDADSMVEVSNNNVREVTGEGIQVMYGTAVTGNVVEEAGGLGYLAYHQYNSFTGNVAKNCGTSLTSANRYSYWVLESDNLFIGNVGFSSGMGANTVEYNFYMANGVVGNVVAYNRFSGANTQQLRLPPAISTNRVHANLGCTTERSAVATIASGTTEISISHFLDITPRPEDFTLHLRNLSTNNPGRVWIPDADIGSTLFKIKCESDPGASGLLLAWSVIARL